MTNALRKVGVGGKRSGRTNLGASVGVDRYLCSSAHLSPPFADYVLGELVEPSLRATSPACGVDLVALVRHAAAARARSVRLRIGLTIASTLPLAGTLAACGLGSGQVFVAGLLLGACGVFVAVLLDRISLYRFLARMVNPQGPMRDLAPPLAPDVEARLEALNRSNVVIFEGGDAFVAWGRKLREGWQMSIDATKPATGGNNTKKKVLPFTPVDLHKAVTLAVRNAGVPDVDVHNRLFVAGHATAAVPGLLPDPLDRPASTVPPASVKQAIEQPRPDVRTYLCIEKTAWGGELAVNLYLRAAMISGDLFIECHDYVLLPLRAELTLIDHMPTGGGEIFFKALGDAITGVKFLSRVPKEMRREGAANRRRRKALATDRRAIKRNRPFGRGAGLSIRAAAAANERFFLFAYTDEEMHLNALQRRILNAIELFLEQHNVDTADFQKRQTNIINNSYDIGSVTGQSVQVGSNNNQQNNNGPQQAPPSPAPWSAP